MSTLSHPTIIGEPPKPIATGSVANSMRNVMTLSVLLFASMLPVTLLVAPLKELVGRRFDAGPFWTHSFMSVNMIGAILATPIISMLSDIGGKRARIAVLALAADACLLAGMSLVKNLAWLLTLRFFEGAAHILAISTLMAIAAGWSGDTKRGRTMGIVGAAMMFGTACGTRLGGEVWRHFPDWTFQLAGMVSAAAAIGVVVFVSESAHDSQERTGFRRVWSLLGGQRRLTIPYLFAFFERLCVGVVISTFVLLLAERHYLSPQDRGSLLACFLIPFALLVYPAGRLVDRVGRTAPLTIGSTMFGLLFATYGLVATTWLIPLMVASGIISAVMFAPSLALCADLAPPKQRGTAFTGFNAAGSLGMLLGPLLSGGLYSGLLRFTDSHGAYQITFVVIGGAFVLFTVCITPLMMRLPHQGT